MSTQINMSKTTVAAPKRGTAVCVALHDQTEPVHYLKNLKTRETMMVKNITIFTTNTCGYCQMVKKYLGAKGMTYEEVNLDEFPQRQAEAMQLSGAMTVPVTVVTKQDESQEVIVGYNLARLAPAVS
jgi:glutaredoxin 3